jgi:L-malate glycosyltransferase
MLLQHQIRNKHICHLVLGLPLGGTEGLVDQMLRHPPKGFETSVICLDEIGILGENAARDGYIVQHFRRGTGINWTIPCTIAKYARDNAIKILHCHHYTPWFYGSLARLFLPKLRVIFTEHGRLYPDIPSLKKKLFNRCVLLRLTNHVTAVSPAVAQAIHRIEGIPLHAIQIVFNGVDEGRFLNLSSKQALRTRFGLKDDVLYFVLCARLDPIKWINGLIKAFKRVVDVQPKTGLIIVGEGSERASIEQQIGELALKDHVIMAGYRTDVPEWLVASDIFVLSSLSEGTSVSLIESLAAGIPAVVTKVGGNEYLVEDGSTGFLVKPQNVEALSAGMLQLAGDASLRQRFGTAAHDKFGKQFEIHRMYESYEKIYTSLVQGQG